MRTHLTRSSRHHASARAGAVGESLAHPRPFFAGTDPDRPRALPDAVRWKMERALGHDFSRIRVYEGGSAPAIGARAFTRGERVHFAPGAFRPHTIEGQTLLGHELAHVVQQRAGVVRRTARLGGQPLNASSALEADADRAGEMAARGAWLAPPRPAPVSGAGSGGDGQVLQGFFDKPWQIAATAVAGLGLGYGAYRYLTRPKPALRIPMQTPEVYDKVKKQIGNDPKVRWNDHSQTMETDYDGRQLVDQYPIGEAIDDSGAGIEPDWAQIEDTFGSADLKAKRVREREALLARTATTVNKFNYADVDRQRPADRVEREARSLNEAPDSVAGVRNLLAEHDGVIFGENHGKPENKNFIANHMTELVGSGVNTLYAEHFRPEHQKPIDEWLSAAPHQPIPAELDRYLTGSEASLGPGLRTLLDAAKTNKVRVRAIDSVAAQPRKMSEDPGLAIRVATMNQFAMETVQADEKRGKGKYVMLVGHSHSNTQPGSAAARDKNINHAIPGLSQLLNVPAVRVHRQTGRPRLDEEDVDNRTRG